MYQEKEYSTFILLGSTSILWYSKSSDMTIYGFLLTLSSWAGGGAWLVITV